MRKTYTLKGLNCVNCAAKIESDVNALECVSHASLHFLTTKLAVEVDDKFQGSITKLIQKIVRSHERDVVLIDHDKMTANIEQGHTHSRQENVENFGAKPVRLIAGALVFAVGILFQHVFQANQTDQTLSFLLYIASYLALGWDILARAAQNILHGKLLDENFLMSVASIGAICIGEYPEAVAVVLFYQTGEFFQSLAVRKSKKSIADLMDIRPDYANVNRNGEINRVSPETVAIGETIIVRPGEKIPLDGVVAEGESTLDTMALTGESVPRRAAVSDTVLSGCVNLNGLLVIEVTKAFSESTVSKIIDLVENAGSKKAPTESFITTFSKYYTPAVVALAVLIAVIPPLLFGGLSADWMKRGLLFLVISCPCALVLSVPMSFFGGIAAASRKGILIKGGNYLEALNHLDIVALDKTGTVTKGVFSVTSINPADGFTKEELLALAAKAEAFSNHPIAVSIQKAHGKEIETAALTEYQEISGFGVSVKADGRQILAGDAKLMDKMDILYEEAKGLGTMVYVAVEQTFAGCVVISDEIKPDSHRAIRAMKDRGVRKAVMLTGDNQQVADSIANALQIDEAHGSLLPGQKVERMETLNAQKRKSGKVAFIGDGINDAPVLARADIGVAMGGIGSDAAIEAADIVLMTDALEKMADAIDIARATRRIVWQNIIFALGVKAVFLALGALGSATMWEAVFADVGVSILAVMNAMRVIRK